VDWEDRISLQALGAVPGLAYHTRTAEATQAAGSLQGLRTRAGRRSIMGKIRSQYSKVRASASRITP